jgi:Mrp family chromosome partitioning ATPase
MDSGYLALDSRDESHHGGRRKRRHGQSTTVLSLAVRASQESARVGMLDLNEDQGDLTKWWLLRGEPMNPRLLEVTKINHSVAAAREVGYEWLLSTPHPAIWTSSRTASW